MAFKMRFKCFSGFYLEMTQIFYYTKRVKQENFDKMLLKENKRCSQFFGVLSSDFGGLISTKSWLQPTTHILEVWA